MWLALEVTELSSRAPTIEGVGANVPGAMLVKQDGQQQSSLHHREMFGSLPPLCLQNGGWHGHAAHGGEEPAEGWHSFSVPG